MPASGPSPDQGGEFDRRAAIATITSPTPRPAATATADPSRCERRVTRSSMAVSLNAPFRGALKAPPDQRSATSRNAVCRISEISLSLEDKDILIMVDDGRTIFAGIDHPPVARAGSRPSTRSVTSAAKQLHLTQPAVTLQLRNLQALAGLPLIQRTGDGMLLTDAGREVLALADRIEAAVTSCQTSLDMIAGKTAGRIAIGAVCTAKYSCRSRSPDFRKPIRISRSRSRSEIARRSARRCADTTRLSPSWGGRRSTSP